MSNMIQLATEIMQLEAQSIQTARRINEKFRGSPYAVQRIIAHDALLTIKMAQEAILLFSEMINKSKNAYGNDTH